MSAERGSREKPFSKFDERFYDRLAFGTGYDGRALWRILHARLAGMSAGIRAALAARTFEVPSISTPGRVWVINLHSMECRDYDSGQACPDRAYNRKQGCCHADAAQVKEKNLYHDQAGVVMFPPRARPVSAALPIDDNPADKASSRARMDYRPRHQVEL